VINSTNTYILKLSTLKLYFKWLYGIKKKGKYPKIVDFPFPERKLNNLTPEDLLTEEEVLKLIEACDRPRDKAIISLLFDSAIRRGELRGLDIKDIKIDGEIGTIEVDGKTGRRSVPISKSIPYLRDWINCHPFKDNPDSPLFISLKGNVGDRLNRETIRYVIIVAKKRAKISKNVFPHLFRHSRLTQLDKKGLSHTAMKYFAGWSKNSDMPSVYSHFSSQDTQEAVFQVDGVVKREEEKKFLEPVVCPNPKCRSLQSPKNLLCSLCSTPLTEEKKKEVKAKRDFLEFIFRPDVWGFLQKKMKKS